MSRRVVGSEHFIDHASLKLGTQNLLRWCVLERWLNVSAVRELFVDASDSRLYVARCDVIFCLERAIDSLAKC